MDFSVMPFEVRAEGDLFNTDLAETGIFLFMNIFNVSINISVVFTLYSTQSAGIAVLLCLVLLCCAFLHDYLLKIMKKIFSHKFCKYTSTTYLYKTSFGLQMRSFPKISLRQMYMHFQECFTLNP
jgi:hypothetical protein